MNLPNICKVIDSITGEHKIRAHRCGNDDESKQCRANHNSGFLGQLTIAHFSAVTKMLSKDLRMCLFLGALRR